MNDYIHYLYQFDIGFELMVIQVTRLSQHQSQIGDPLGTKEELVMGMDW